jgi:hypothetical protein
MRYNVAMTVPVSIRFSTDLLNRLRRRAQAMTGASVAGLAQRLIDEGLRMSDHPGVIFKDGATGRRAALAYGPDIWEVIKFLREVDERGPAAFDAAAEVFAVDASRISAAISYYGDYQEEIDAEIAEADATSAQAEHAWRIQQQLIA